MAVKMKSLMDSTGFDQVCKLKYDTYTAGDFWILSDGYQVSIVKQKEGERATQEVAVPIKEFRKLIRAFIKKQPLRG